MQTNQKVLRKWKGALKPRKYISNAGKELKGGSVVNTLLYPSLHPTFYYLAGEMW